MNGNIKEIEKLRGYQKDKKKQIKSYKKKMKKHVFSFSIVLTILSLILLEFAYTLFGNSVMFLLFFISILIIFIIVYKIIVSYKIKQREREIKRIRVKLYQLMKLNNA